MKRQYEPDPSDAAQRAHANDDILYKSLPNVTAAPPDAALSLLEQMPPFFKVQQTPKLIYDTHIMEKPFRLDNAGKNNSTLRDAAKDSANGGVRLDKVGEAAVRRGKTTKRLKLSRSELKDRGLFEVDRSVPYSAYNGLMELWEQYATQLIGNKCSAAEAAQKISMADLHGAKLRVVEAKNVSMGGSSGVVVQETAKTFKMMGEDNKMRTVPKAHTVFEITVAGRNFILHGDHMEYSPGMRAKNRLKPRQTIDFLA